MLLLALVACRPPPPPARDAYVWQRRWTEAVESAVVEGAPLFDSVGTTPAEPYRVASVDVTVADGNLTLEAGQTDQYTMLNWLSIVPKD